MAKFLLAPVIIALLVGMILGFSPNNSSTAYHTEEDVDFYRSMMNSPLPEGFNSLFAGSGKCAGCHGHDPAFISMITSEGEDVNVTDDWRSTMMANSAKDPFWRAKVSHEVLVNPAHQVELEDKCTSCHAPYGKYGALNDGFDHYSIAEMAADPVALDGVSCGACHQQNPANIGNAFSGVLAFQPQVMYGPYGDDPDEAPLFAQPMVSFVGFEPIYGAHISKSELCASCHTLITQTVDLEGEFTGNNFVEQATYHEWLNSQYSQEATKVECQGCHLPRIQDSIVISANYAFLQDFPRSPYGLHYLAGANTHMLEILKNNIDPLALTATAEQFDRTIDRTRHLLQNESLMLELVSQAVYNDTLSVTYRLTNKTGHKFPSGYPARRLFIEYTLTQANGQPYFSSGILQEGYEVQGQNADYEPHYDAITAEDQVQIYEMVMGDVNGDVTTVLERADLPIKDNRLVPLGFSTTHAAYDTTLIAGDALNDADFNHLEGEEGSGSDEITYKVNISGYTGTLNISARVYYQSNPPKWMDEMFAESTPEIDAFKLMYEATPPVPELVAELYGQQTLISVGEQVRAVNVGIAPNPTEDGRVVITSPERIVALTIYALDGKLIARTGNLSGQRAQAILPDAPGNYVLEVTTTAGTAVRKVVRK